MNKLGQRRYIQLIAETLVSVYGDTLKEQGTDVKMAEAVIRTLDEYLYFHPHDMNYNEYRKWKKLRKIKV
jgi:hypothetical protein